jgi:hypothetical protein
MMESEKSRKEVGRNMMVEDVGHKREGMIAKQLKLLAEDIAILQSTVKQLHESLVLVLREPSPSEAGEAMARCSKPAPMVRAIEELQIQVTASRKELQDILDRLEL